MLSEWNHSFTLAQSMGWGLFLCSKPPTSGILVSPIKWRCLVRVLCPVRWQVTTLDCVLLKDRSLVFAGGLGHKISFWACLWVLIGSHHIATCWMSIQCFIFLLIFSGSPYFGTVLSLASLSASFFHHTPACPRTQNSPAVWRVEMSFNTFWHCCTNRDLVLAAWRAFRATWLSEQILTYFPRSP